MKVLSLRKFIEDYPHMIQDSNLRQDRVTLDISIEVFNNL